MRLLAAGLLVSALLLAPMTAATNSTSVGLSNPTGPWTTNLAANVTAPITVTLSITQPICQADDTAKVTLTVTKTGNVTATLDASSVSFTIPATVAVGAVPQPQDYHGNKDVNITITPTGPGASTINVVAAFDGKLSSCNGQPDPASQDFETGFTPSRASINITTQSTFAGPTPVSSTPVSSTPVGSTPASSTPAGSTPVASSPIESTPTGETPTPEDQHKGFLGIPGPTVPLVVAAVVAVAVLARRK